MANISCLLPLLIFPAGNRFPAGKMIGCPEDVTHRRSPGEISFPRGKLEAR